MKNSVTMISIGIVLVELSLIVGVVYLTSDRKPAASARAVPCIPQTEKSAAPPLHAVIAPKWGPVYKLSPEELEERRREMLSQ